MSWVWLHSSARERTLVLMGRGEERESHSWWRQLSHCSTVGRASYNWEEQTYRSTSWWGVGLDVVLAPIASIEYLCTSQYRLSRFGLAVQLTYHTRSPSRPTRPPVL
jgi:hypothetical protein